MTKEDHKIGGKEILSKSCSSKEAFSSDREDNNAHVGKNQKRRNDATFSNGTSPLGNAEFGKQGVVVEEVVHTTIGTFEEGTIVLVIGLSKVQASGLLKSKVPRLPCPKCKADPRKNYASKKAKSDISNAGEDISQSFGSHHESVLVGKNKCASGAEYYSFEKKSARNFCCIQGWGILWYYFPPSLLDATVMGDLLDVEKLLGYKPEENVGEHFMRCMQRYIKKSASILRSYLVWNYRSQNYSV